MLETCAPLHWAFLLYSRKIALYVNRPGSRNGNCFALAITLHALHSVFFPQLMLFFLQ